MAIFNSFVYVYQRVYRSIIQHADPQLGDGMWLRNPKHQLIGRW